MIGHAGFSMGCVL